ncbi:MAG: LysR family transcriptional regulator [Burkholderiaceae bacterium]|nr:LysR family transcriptional regulator [Burkholderiaceae bacterium]
MFDLSNVALFVKIVETGSIAAAARQLGIPGNTAGRRLAQLEEALGLSLVQRTTRKLQVTPAGNHYYEQCAQQIAKLNEATRTLADSMREPSGRLRVAAPIGLSEILDMAAVADFLRKYPGLEFELCLGEESFNLIEKGIDIALCAGAQPSSTLKARSLGEFACVMVASRAYLARAGQVEAPEDLVRHDCLVDLSLPGKFLWRLTDGAQHAEVKVAGRFAANSPSVLLKMACNDFGIALLPKNVVRPDLARGTLVHVMPRFQAVSEHFYALYPSHRQRSRAVQAFMDFMIEWARTYQLNMEHELT